jgi:hypothetical protein
MSDRDNPGNCRETYATFRLYGRDLVPDAITVGTGISPSGTQLRGDRRKGIYRPADVGMWKLTSRGHVESTDLETHIVWLLDLLEPVRDALQPYTSEVEGSLWQDPLPGVVAADICCFWLSQTGHGGPLFSPRLMHRLSSMNLALWMDNYFVSEGE